MAHAHPKSTSELTTKLGKSAKESPDISMGVLAIPHYWLLVIRGNIRSERVTANGPSETLFSVLCLLSSVTAQGRSHTVAALSSRSSNFVALCIHNLTLLATRRFNRTGMSMHSQPLETPSRRSSIHSGGRADREHRSHGRRLVHRTPYPYRFCDQLSEGIIYAMIVFSPWAFGTTEPWAIWVMNTAGYALGALLAAKWAVRLFGRYSPPRWGDGGHPRWPIRLLAALTVVLLAWCFVSALNARATLDFESMEFAYRDNSIPWLPHSYHAPVSWFEFWKYLGLACTFWALRDWLLGQTRRERLRKHRDEVDEDEPFADLPPEPGTRLPVRLRRFLWVVCLNGAALAGECILQRLDGTNKLLWLIEPVANNTNESQFGPYAYRSNAAQYLNLVWPLCLGLWWTLRHEMRRGMPGARRLGASPHLLLLPCAALIAAAPLFSMSRGGVLITIGTVPIAAAIVYIAARRHRSRWPWLVPAVVAIALAGAAVAAWPAIKPRLYAPRKVYPISSGLALNDLTMRCIFRVPQDASKVKSGLLVGLAKYETGWYSIPPGVALGIQRSGPLTLTFLGADGKYNIVWLMNKFVERYRGQTVDVVVVRKERARLFINGAPVQSAAPATTPAPTTNAVPSEVAEPPPIPPLTTNAVAAAYMLIEPTSIVFDSPPALVSVWDIALDDAEVAALNKRYQEGTIAVGQDQQFARPMVELTHDQIRAPAFLMDQMSGRRETYFTAQQMKGDYPWLGSGPGTYGALYGLYRPSTRDRWTWWAHNDWLEFRVTFGRVGLGLALAALILAAVAPFRRGGIAVPRALTALICVGMIGCLVHARFDFPFQIYSIGLLFLVQACLCSVVSRR